MSTNNEGFARLFQNFENVIHPKKCKKTGNIPNWLKGTMVRNGPGMFEIGDSKYNHWFDGLAYMQRYHFENGNMFYSARFLESECYNANMQKNRIVRGSFGTASFPDPCKTIFSRFFSHFFKEDPKHDNANVSFTAVGDQIFACTETPFMYRIDLDTLETKEFADFSKYVALHTCTAHHTTDENGNVYNIGSQFGKNAVHVFTVTKNKENCDGNPWSETFKIGEIPCSDPLNPTYMHSFGMSQNYLVMFEAPIRINIKRFLMRKVISTSFGQCLYWDSSKNVKVFILNKKTGQKNTIKYTVDPFFTFHHSNTFEKNGCIVLDYCRMEEAGNFDSLLIDNLKTGAFRNRPKFLPYLCRLILPLEIRNDARSGENLLDNLDWADGCEAVLQSDGSVKLKEKQLCSFSMEFPRYHLQAVNMKDYKYCYGTSVMGDNSLDSLNGIIKADLKEAKHLVWKKENHNQLCGEPIFVPDPNGIEEDDGLLIVPVMSLSDDNDPFVIILNARDLNEMARFKIPEARIPLGFHAIYQKKFAK